MKEREKRLKRMKETIESLQDTQRETKIILAQRVNLQSPKYDLEE